MFLNVTVSTSYWTINTQPIYDINISTISNKYIEYVVTIVSSMKNGTFNTYSLKVFTFTGYRLFVTLSTALVVFFVFLRIISALSKDNLLNYHKNVNI